MPRRATQCYGRLGIDIAPQSRTLTVPTPSLIRTLTAGGTPGGAV
jgi:hypothetical protein